MLTEKTIEEAGILARELTAKDILLKPIGDSPLLDLIASSTPVENPSDDSFKISQSVLAASANVSNIDGRAKHSEDMVKYAWGLSESLSSTISLARNTINPMVKEVLENIDGRINGEIYYNNGINIKSYFIPEIMKSGEIEELTDRYKNVAYSQIDWGSNAWPSMDADSLKKAAKGKTGSLNSQIDKLIETLDDNSIVNIYDYLFRLQLLNDPDFDENIVYIMGFLWSLTWINDVPEGLNLNLKQLSLDLTSLKSNCGKHIQDNLKKFERMSKQGFFILKTPKLTMDKKTFIVQGEIYNSWLEKGNSPEILIGAWLSNNINDLVNISEEQRKRWARRYRLDNDIRRQEFDTKKQVIVTKELSSFIDDIISENNYNRREIRERFNSLISDRPFRVTENLQKWVRMILCKSLYPDSDILTILNNIDSIMEKDPDIPPREAATMSAVDLIVDWLFSALTVEYVRS